MKDNSLRNYARRAGTDGAFWRFVRIPARITLFRVCPLVGYTSTAKELRIETPLYRPNNSEQLSELYLLVRDYETAILVTGDQEEKLRLRRFVHELKACILRIKTG